MMDRIMKWVSEHILLVPMMMLMVVSLVGCKTIPIIKEKTTASVRQREIPVFTPQIDVAAFGKIEIKQGKPILSDVKVIDNREPDKPKPKVSVSIDEDGYLLVDMSIPPDTAKIIANDSIINIETITEVEVEKKLSWWQQLLIFLGALVVLIGFVKFVLILKVKE